MEHARARVLPLDGSVTRGSGALGAFPPLFNEGREGVGGGGFAAETGGFDVGDLLGQCSFFAVGHGLGMGGA